MNRNSKVDRVEGFVMGTIWKRWLRVLVMSCGVVTACYGQAESTQKQGPIIVLPEDCGGYAALVDEKKDCLVTADLACGELWKVQRDLLREIELRRYRVLSGFLSMLEVRLRKVRARGNASDPNLLAATRLLGACQVARRLLAGEPLRAEGSVSGVEEELREVSNGLTAVPRFVGSFHPGKDGVDWSIARPEGFYLVNNELSRLFRAVMYLRHLRIRPGNDSQLRAFLESSGSGKKYGTCIGMIDKVIESVFGRYDCPGFFLGERPESLLSWNLPRDWVRFLEIDKTRWVHEFGEGKESEDLGRLPLLFDARLGKSPSKLLGIDGKDYRSAYIGALVSLASKEEGVGLGGAFSTKAWRSVRYWCVANAFLSVRFLESLVTGGPIIGVEPDTGGAPSRIFVEPCPDVFRRLKLSSSVLASAAKGVADLDQFVPRPRESDIYAVITSIGVLDHCLGTLTRMSERQSRGQEVLGEDQATIRTWLESMHATPPEFHEVLVVAPGIRIREGRRRYVSVPLSYRGARLRAYGVIRTVQRQCIQESGEWSNWKEIELR